MNTVRASERIGHSYRCGARGTEGSGYRGVHGSANNPMIPHTIVLEPGLVVYKIYNGYWFFGRPTIEELRRDLRAVSKNCRADWDITDTELKAAWVRGEKERFYPYGKSYAKVFGEQE